MNTLHDQRLALFGVPRKEWSRKGGTFNVQVVNHFKDVSATMATYAEHGLSQDDGGQRWNVYAFIFPVHPLFALFDPKSDSFYQDVIAEMPFHSGASYLRRHFNDKGEVVCYQVGSDYNHLCDERFTRAYEPDEAGSVFRDACDLFEHLERAVAAPVESPLYGPEQLWTCEACKSEQPTDRACDVCEGQTKPVVSPGAAINFDRGVE